MNTKEELQEATKNFYDATHLALERIIKDVHEIKSRLDLLPKPELDLMEEAAQSHNEFLFATKHTLTHLERSKIDVYQTYIEALKNQEVVEQLLDLSQHAKQTWHRVKKMPEFLSFDPNRFRLASPIGQTWGLLKIAFREGKEIEYRVKGANQDWSLCVNPIWDNDQIEYRLKEQEFEEDPFAELKKEHAKGAVIQFRSQNGIEDKWIDCGNNSPYWKSYTEYRIKPQEQREPKVGDVCKFWDHSINESFCIGILTELNENNLYKYLVKPMGGALVKKWINCEVLSKEQVLEHFFGKEAQDE